MIIIDTVLGRSYKLKHFRSQADRVNKSGKSTKAYPRAQHLALSNGLQTSVIKQSLLKAVFY